MRAFKTWRFGSSLYFDCLVSSGLERRKIGLEDNQEKSAESFFSLEDELQQRSLEKNDGGGTGLTYVF
jgi:hypothetical protein